MLQGLNEYLSVWLNDSVAPALFEKSESGAKIISVNPNDLRGRIRQKRIRLNMFRQPCSQFYLSPYER